MQIIRKTFIVLGLLTIFLTFSSYQNQAFARGKGMRRHGPPPEAYAACAEKSEGDKAEFKSPHGDTVTGTCVEDGDRLVLRPDHPPRGREPKGSEAPAD